MPSIPDNLAFMQLYPVVVAAYIFGREWKAKKIMFICDNQSEVSILLSVYNEVHENTYMVSPKQQLSFFLGVDFSRSTNSLIYFLEFIF